MKKTLVKMALIVFVAAFVLVICLPVLLYAATGENATVTVVKGAIESIDNDSIVVNSSRYTVIGVAIEKTLGKPAKKDDLQRGKKVTLFFENKKLTNILVYEGDMAR
jgi:competence protein ComGC